MSEDTVRVKDAPTPKLTIRYDDTTGISLSDFTDLLQRIVYVSQTTAVKQKTKQARNKPLRLIAGSRFEFSVIRGRALEPSVYVSSKLVLASRSSSWMMRVFVLLCALVAAVQGLVVSRTASSSVLSIRANQKLQPSSASSTRLLEKPLDASDILTLEQAKAEIRNYRRIAKMFQTMSADDLVVEKTATTLKELCQISKEACDVLTPMCKAFYQKCNASFGTAKLKADATFFSIADGIVQHLLVEHLFAGDKFGQIVGEEDETKVRVSKCRHDQYTLKIIIVTHTHTHLYTYTHTHTNTR